MFNKVLIANRGEIACRIARACKTLGVQPVFVYSEADKNLPYIKEADEAHCLGEPLASKSYLNQEKILEVAARARCQALHPGYGFLAENAIFAQRCLDHKIEFIGPAPAHLQSMGNKAEARETMKRLGLPVIPGSDGRVQTECEAKQIAREIGYPFLFKASAGGGGRGMRVVRAESELAEQFHSAAMESRAAFGNGDLYMERFFDTARHVEFQVLGDAYGHVVHLLERECSIQRKHQKLLEEAPANGLSSAKRQALGSKITRALAQLNYKNAGTIEFLVDELGNYYFMEMNTRIQVEHPVTEMITGVDLVAWQIKVAAGQKLSLKQSDIKLSGHAMECRLNAEDPSQNFKPSPGKISKLTWPTEAANKLRIDTFLQSGTEIPTFYDSMVGKVIVHTQNRAESLAAMKRALSQTKLEGIVTTIDFQRAILSSKPFQDGVYTTNYIDSGAVAWPK